MNANTISLETPLGAVLVNFGYAQCLVELPDKDPQAPAKPLEVNGRPVCGALLFERQEGVWQFQPAHRFNFCEYADTQKPASPGRRTKLINTLGQCLGEWCQANPEALEAVYQAVDAQHITQLEAEMRDLDKQITRLLNGKAERQALIDNIHKLRQFVDAK